jgi:mono/diheme cytochrome c family protein
MMKVYINLKSVIFLIASSLLAFAGFISCSPSGGNNPGDEYMPDMSHSIAYEANLYNYYSYNTWGEKNDYKAMAMPRKPVAGTIPRGYAGMSSPEETRDMEHHFQSMTVNGFVPYYYEDTEEERTRAMNEITENPYPISNEGLESAKELYNIYCGICHGEKGDGLGYLVREDGGLYPAAPANFLLPEFVSSSEGRYYHSIMYGKNVMGSYTDKLSYKERWEVIHYIRSLQAKDQGLQYDENVNTLNDVGVPYATIADQMEEHSEDDMDQHESDVDHESSNHH